MLSIQRKLVYLFFFLPIFLFSQNDSLKILSNDKKPTVRYFNQNQFEYSDSVVYLENSLYDFSKYIPKNNLGNNGLPFTDLIYPLSNIDYLGFNYSKNNYKSYFFSPQNLKFYNTRTPFTDLFYVIGSKREQVFRVAFSYNVKKNWNLTANFNRTRSEGFYSRQNTNDNYIALSSNYKSENNRYYLLTSVIFNSAKNAENGGIVSDTFLTSDIKDKKVIAINLSSAKRTNTNRIVCLKHYFNLGDKLQDSLKSIAPKSRILLTTLYEDNILTYEDDKPWSGYYKKIYFDSTRTFDSICNRKIENELSWKRVNSNNHNSLGDVIGVGFNIKHQLIKIEQREFFKVPDVNISIPMGLVNTTQQKIDTTLNNIIMGAELFNTYSNNQFWWNVSGKYGLSGYNKEDHYLGFIAKKITKDSAFQFGLKLEDKLQAPDFIYNHYLSNHFVWENNFDKMRESRATFQFFMNRYKLIFNASYSNYSNVLYFNDSALARQTKGSTPVASFFLKKDFILYNWHLNNTINYQYVSNSSVIRLPEFVLNHSLYYESDVFKHAMRLQIGASVFYTSAYYANAYMPATAQFYLQDKKKYGNYPFIDFFICAKIRTARIFFKIDHLNSGLMGYNYMIVPNYPINDRAFKFGVSWMFFD
jgi:hypothetical protein